MRCVLSYLKPNEKLILDTSRMYQAGETEEMIGEILKDHPELKERVELHTKAHPL